MGCALRVRVADVEQRRWLSRQLAQVGGLADALARGHAFRVARDGGEVFGGNSWLRGVVDRLRVLPGLPADCGDDAIGKRAQVLAESAAKMVRAGQVERAESVLAGPLGLAFGDRIPEESRGARLMCEAWWRRQLRTVCARRAEAVARDIGMVARGRAPYVSDHGFFRWVAASRRNAAFLAQCEAVNDAGQVFGLDELAALSVSNPVVRRAELMVRVRGAEEWAEKSGGWAAAFLTITCPSSFHARLSAGVDNPRYSGASPREGAEYLAAMWARCRADLARRGLRWWGLRVAEPHQDGTPHWHLLVYAAPEHVGELVAVVRSHALREAGGEPGAARYRFQSVELPVGAAAGYVAKYVSKNVDGFGVGEDFEAGQFASDSAARVRAWASIWGVRQFAWIGAPAVTVWRELRRVEALGDAGGLWGELVAAADAGDWCRYLGLMGGAAVRAGERPAAPWRRFDAVGRYGEAVARVVGVVCQGVGEVLTRVREWVVVVGARSRALGLVSITVRGGGDGRAGAGGVVVRGVASGGGCAPVHSWDGCGAVANGVGDGWAKGGGGYGFA